jgi:hypothetical protein
MNIQWSVSTARLRSPGVAASGPLYFLPAAHPIPLVIVRREGRQFLLRYNPVLIEVGTFRAVFEHEDERSRTRILLFRILMVTRLEFGSVAHLIHGRDCFMAGACSLGLCGRARASVGGTACTKPWTELLQGPVTDPTFVPRPIKAQITGAGASKL